MELILMRHGTTQGNLERRFIGTLDVPLLPQGEELARLNRAVAQRADRVYEVVCGIPIAWKGANP